jgi:hypothetical protein
VESDDGLAVDGEQEGGNVDVVLEGRLPAGGTSARLLGEAVERLAVLFGEALGELQVLGASRSGSSASLDPSARMSSSSRP